VNSDVEIIFKNNKYPFMLAKDRDGKKQWSVQDSAIIPPMFVTDRPLAAHVPPERDVLSEQDFMYGGMGEEYYEEGTYRIYKSPNVDARIKGIVVPGPKSVKSTITTSTTACPSIVNPGFETGDTTGWTDLTGVSSDYKYEGLYAGEESGPSTFYQDLSVDINTWKGRVAIVSAYCRSALGATVSIGIDDGVGSTYSTGTTTVSWTKHTAEHTLSASATRIRIVGKVEGAQKGLFDSFSLDRLWSFLKGATTLTKGAVIDFAKYGGSLYAACGNALLKWDNTDWDDVAIFPATITDLSVWGDYLFVALGTSDFYWYYDGTTWTQSTLTTGKMKYLGVVGDTLYGSSSDYHVKAADNPLNGGSWGTATTIIGQNTVITSIVDHPTSLFVGTQDGFYLVGETVQPVISLLSKESDTNTSKNAIEYNGSVYVPSGLGSLYEYAVDSETLTNVTPSLSIPGQNDFQGRVMAIEGDQSYLWVAIDYGTKAEILAGRWEAVGSSVAFRWHQMRELTLTATSGNIGAMRISSDNGVRRLWLGCTNTTDGIYYLHHPEAYGDITLDSDYRFATTGELWSPWHRTEYPYIAKVFYSLSVRGDNLDANKTIAAHYRKEGETSWTSLGTVTRSPLDTLYFPANTAALKMQLKFVLATNSETSVPQFKGYTLRALARPFNLEQGRLTINEYGEIQSFGGWDTSWIHQEYAATPKNWYSITLITQGLTASKTLTIKYKLDDDAEWTTLETIATQSPHTVLYFPENTVGRVMYLFFTLSSPTDTSLIAYILDGKLRPESRKEIEFVLNLAAQQSTRTGGISIAEIEAKADTLREMRNYAWPVTIKLFNGQEYTATIDKIQENISVDAVRGPTEYLFGIKAIEAGV